MYPDQSLYPSDSVPNLLMRIQNALRRADEIHHMNGDHTVDWYVPLVADAEAGFGGVLHAYELMKLMIAAGGPRRALPKEPFFPPKSGASRGLRAPPPQAA